MQCSQVQLYHREHIRPHSLVPAGVLNLRLQCFVGGLTVPRPPALNAAQMLVALAFGSLFLVPGDFPFSFAISSRY